MNNLMLLVVLGVAFVYCGGSNVPAVLRNNKQLLGGVVVGLFLCSFFGMRLEGMKNNGEDKCDIATFNLMEADKDLRSLANYKDSVTYKYFKTMAEEECDLHAGGDITWDFDLDYIKSQEKLMKDKDKNK